MKVFYKILYYLKRISFYFFLFLMLYGIAAFSFSKITVNSEADANEKEVTIYIKTNGVHTDIVVPLKNEVKDWTKVVKLEKTKSKDTTMAYVAFGWGDKGFYLNTPQWSDLKYSTAFNAAFGLGDSAIHATFFRTINEDRDCIRIEISKANYQKLIDYIEDSFLMDSNQDPIFISATTYGLNDSFYEAKGRYSLFHTCNTWANSALKSANLKAALWTVTDTGIFCHYQ